MAQPSESMQSSERIHIKLRINLNLGSRNEFIEKHARFIGKTGIYIKTKEKAPKGSRIEFEYLLNNDRRVFHGVGVVLNCNEGNQKDIPPGLSVELVDIDALSETLLRESIDKYGEGKLAPKRARTTDEVFPAKTSKSASSTKPQILKADDEELEELLGVLDTPTVSDSDEGLSDFDIDLDFEESERSEPTEEPSEPAKSKKTKTGSYEIDMEALEQENFEELPSTATKSVLIDLCGASPLAIVHDINDDAFDVQKAILYPEKIAAMENSIELGDEGVWLPNFASWYTHKRSDPYANLILERLHISPAEPEKDEFKIIAGTAALSMKALLKETLKHIISKLDVEPCPAFIIVPNHATDELHQDTLDEMSDLGFSETTFIPESELAFGNARKKISPKSLSLKIAMTLFETRMLITQGDKQVIGQHWSIDESLWEADRSILEHLSLELLRQHQIDIGNDLAAMADLLSQTTHLRRTTPASGAWTFNCSDKAIKVNTETLSTWCKPITKRVIANCAHLLRTHKIAAEDIEVIHWNLEEMAWPGLAPELSQGLSLQSILPNTGIWSRLAVLSENIKSS